MEDLTFKHLSKNGTIYINCRYGKIVETIDELPYVTADQIEVARNALSDYKISYAGMGDIYFSNRSDMDWKKK